MKVYSVVGTDTDVGKTYVSCALLQYWKSMGKRCVAFKPIAAGCDSVSIGTGGFINQDALALMKTMTVDLSYEQVNPVALEAYASPHIASALSGVECSASSVVSTISHSVQELGSSNAIDYALIEGAGGWFAPISERETMADIMVGLQHSVILVVGMKLGCLNHALLTAAAIEKSGLVVAGWVANEPQLSSMAFLAENIMYLKDHLPGQFLGSCRYGQRALECGVL